MIHAKNYRTMTKFVKVMPRKLWLLFPGHGVNYLTYHLRVLSRNNNY